MTDPKTLADEAAELAAEGGFSTHLCPEVSAHLMRITETAHWLEWQDWAAPCFKNPLPSSTDS